jgi:hypothetical protein
MKKLLVFFMVLFYYFYCSAGFGKPYTDIYLQKSKGVIQEVAPFQRPQSFFILSPNTTLILDKHVYLIVSTDIILQSDVCGDGVLIIKGNRIFRLDAHHYKIDKLYIESKPGVELQSTLMIGKELCVIEGNFYLNDYNIILDNCFVPIRTGKWGELVLNGSGCVIANQPPLVFSRLPSFKIKIPCYCNQASPVMFHFKLKKYYLPIESIVKSYQPIASRPPP